MSDDIRFKIEYNPQDDITVWELAQCVKWLLVGVVEKEKWPIEEKWTRHFKIEDVDYGAMIKDTGKALRDLMDELDVEDEDDEDW
jgi:hypothetical protein